VRGESTHPQPGEKQGNGDDLRSRADLETLAVEITPAAERLMEACWPGPLTIVFHAAAAVPSVLTAGTGTIGVRLTAHPDVQRLLEAVGGPLTATSANRSGRPPATTVDEVERTLGDGVDAILNGGATPGGLAIHAPPVPAMCPGSSLSCAFACPPWRFVLTSGRPFCYNK